MRYYGQIEPISFEEMAQDIEEEVQQIIEQMDRLSKRAQRLIDLLAVIRSTFL